MYFQMADQLNKILFYCNTIPKTDFILYYLYHGCNNLFNVYGLKLLFQVAHDSEGFAIYDAMMTIRNDVGLFSIIVSCSFFLPIQSMLTQ